MAEELFRLGGKVLEELPGKLKIPAVGIAPISNLYLDRQIVKPETAVIVDTFGHTSVTLFIEVNKAVTITLAEVSQDGIRWRMVEERITEFKVEGSEFVDLEDVIKTKAVLLYRFFKIRIDAGEPVQVTLELASKLLGAMPTLKEIRDFLYLLTYVEYREIKEIIKPIKLETDIFVYPPDGEEKTFPAGRTEVDFYDGEVLFSNGTRGRFTDWLKRCKLDFATCLFIESDKTVKVQIENMGWQRVVADTSFLETRVPFRKVFLETTEAATITIWASPNPDAILLKLKKSLFQTTNQGAWEHNHVTVPVPGTAVPLSSDLPIPDGFNLCIIALPTNTNTVYTGNSKANASNVAKNVPLSGATKDKQTIGVTNANLIWVDALVAGEGVVYFVEKKA